MAQIEPTDKGGKKKKGAQKKIAIHVDFTPMVDMNMLLITFFMLCTTMIKSQTLQVRLPAMSDNKKDQIENNQVSQDDAITMIVGIEKDANGEPVLDEKGHPISVIYYYTGAQNENTELKVAHFPGGNTSAASEAIRTVLADRNENILKEYNELKKKYKNREITKEEFDKRAQENIDNPEYRKQPGDPGYSKDWKNPPVVIVKMMPDATCQSFVSAADEMQVNQIPTFNFSDPQQFDLDLIEKYKRTH